MAVEAAARWRSGSFALSLGCALVSVTAARGARADEAPAERPISTSEVEAWLDRPTGAPSSDSLTPGPDEAPPPPPRKHGVTVEAGLGALSHLGPLRNVSPLSPWFHLKVGVDALRWLLLFAETDLIFSNTSYAHPPPPARTYRLHDGGGGLRLTVAFSDRFGAYLEGSLGLAAVSSDVLEQYGYVQATRLQPYFGGRLGLDWYPLDPHLALSVHGGVRSYQAGLARERSSQPALAALGGLALRYTF